MLKKHLVILSGVILLSLSLSTQAFFMLREDQEETVNSFYGHGILFDQSRVNILSDGYVNQLDSYDSSTVGVHGGSVSRLCASTNSYVGISGGYVDWLGIYNLSPSNTPRASITGGTVGTLLGSFNLKGDEQVTVSANPLDLLNQCGVSVQREIVNNIAPWELYLENNSNAKINGGVVSTVFAKDSSQVDISGGDVKNLYTYSIANISGGWVGQLKALDSSTVNLSGNGYIDNLDAYSSEPVTISGGEVKELQACDSSIVNISGGKVGKLNALNSSTVNISGNDFTANIGELLASGGTIRQTAGTVESNCVTIGSYSNSKSTMTVDGKDSRWTNSSTFIVGEDGDGEVLITNGGTVNSGKTIIGYHSAGGVSVEGIGSKWINSSTLVIGDSGSGFLWVKNGGAAASSYSTLGAAAGSVGKGLVDGTDSKWTTDYLLTVGESGKGTLSVSNGGLLSSNQSTLGANPGSIGEVTVNDPNSQWTNQTDLTVGKNGEGRLSISNGGTVRDNSCTIGQSFGSTGYVTVDGTDSTWTNKYNLTVGNGGNGTLSITNGGRVSNYNGCIGQSSDSISAVSVRGPGSKWTNANNLSIGDSGTGVLSITDGGTVEVDDTAEINEKSLLLMDIGSGSTLKVGDGINTGELTNDGIVRLVASMNVPAGLYHPIIAKDWHGDGIWQAIGGRWHDFDHTFIVYEALTGQSGDPMRINLNLNQRVMITDSLTGQSVGVAFDTTDDTSSLTLTATIIGDDALASLPSDKTVLGGWEFAIDGYTVSPENPAFLSINIGPGQSLDKLNVWHYDNGVWSPYSVNDLTYDGTNACFTVTGFSGYAVTTVPEPVTLVMLVMGLLVHTRRKSR